MKKTLTANISGTVFHIEEDAYDALNRYLGNIRSRFSGTAGRDDIMADIEARIAELFQERLDGRRQVVSIADVEQVMAVLGQPEDIAGGEDGQEGAPEPGPAAAGAGNKRFYRDTDDKWLGGVLGGLGAYLGMDPLWLRIAVVALVLASVGSLIPIYLLLWILVPKAGSAAERLRMRGEPVTVDNIKRVVEEGAERFKRGGERMAHEASELGRTWGEHAGQRRSQAVNIFLKLIGVGLIVVAFSLLLGLITGMIGGTVSLWHATWSNEELGILDMGELLFNSREQALWMGIGITTLLIVPIIGLFLSGFRLLLETRTPRWLGLTLLFVWLAAWIPVIYTGVALGKDFKRSNSTLTEVELVQPTGGTLYLDAKDPADNTGDWSMSYDDGEVNVDFDGVHVSNGSVFGAWGRLDIQRSADSLFHLKVEREAHGISTKVALARAGNVDFQFTQEQDVLHVSPVISYPVTDKFRGQDVQFTLEVPLGKSVYLRPGSKHVIHDIENVTNTYDRDMLGRTWTMTERGLVDPNAAPKRDGWDAPKDTIRAKHAPVAAVVWEGPSKRSKSTTRERRPTASTASASSKNEGVTSKQVSLAPNLLGSMFRNLR
ncbi:MAG: PspC domain-containing protein [Flavobacteriales bacterium]|nr:PspC domain-containing protein [Flavobacteriales bacterium]MCB9178528.1 PspC domain-containing protein [Flavobacteriales bacterium]HPF89238.1 PspC domain-containing protein [Flavobacteriales bacterium]